MHKVIDNKKKSLKEEKKSTNTFLDVAKSGLANVRSTIKKGFKNQN